MSGIDLHKVTAIDVHTHVQLSVKGGPSSLAEGPGAALADVFGNADSLTLPELAAYYRERSMACVAFIVDVVDDPPAVGNEEVLDLAAAEQDTVIPFASVDPHRGAEGVTFARRLVEDHGARGFKFHPSVQKFRPDDRLAYPLYEVIAGYGLPAIFHTGQTAVGAGQRGGGGILLKYANPLYLDEVAADFPDMQVVMAHPSVPWQDEALSVAGHKPNVYIDLSGWSPKYFPPQLVQHANSLLKHKVLFGSDFPALTPDRWLADFAKLEIKPEVLPLILKENAARLLGLEKAKT